ncbi:immunoglobulin-like protein involved in spore germination [Micromonospora pisi]|uniref:Immunoglobulin-like protein involved in spore germination n=1 Tax=Micromonospora pisi TaxID=589240 RepID=A0A495JRX3_9ACTN|nr:GerMN domain-containing protein [Micromonospora pisi]RKR91713.1 immunoglobulin-like protein involved in spore germination [Micromonospora pisi]
MNEELLRRMLAEEAARVEVSPVALASIRRRIRRRWWRRIRVVPIGRGLVGAAAVVLTCVVGVSTCGPLAGPGSPAGPVTAPVAVYYQGGDPERRLYREFRQLAVGDGSSAARVRAAVRELLAPDGADDPDYGSGWPAGSGLRGVTVDTGTATVDLSGVAGRSGAVSHPADDRGAEQTVQQLVWTVTAVTGITGVRVLLDGAPVDRLWERVDVRGVLRRGPAVDVLAPVWLIDPQQGDRVGGRFEVHVAALAGEPTVHLRVRQGDRTVAEQVLALSAGPSAQGEAELVLTLAPGDYTLRAYVVSVTDGAERFADDHRVTVG